MSLTFNKKQKYNLSKTMKAERQ